MTDIVWSDPPKKAGNWRGRAPSEEWESVAEQLRRNPGIWALVKTTETRSNANAISRRIKLGEIKAFEPAGSFGATVRETDEGFRIWARKT